MPRKPLDRILIEEPYRFEFFQSVRIINKLFRDRKLIGTDALPSEEAVRFRSRVAFDFPASEIHEIHEIEDEATGKMHLETIQNFMGMVGVSGVLPTHYTELVLDRIRHRDTAMWSFLDIFTHRAVSLFYRAWAKYRFPVGYERGDDSFTSYLFDLVGLGTAKLRGRMDVPDESLLPYGGLIAQRPHSANALENILTDYFGAPARVGQFFGQWLDLSVSDRTKLGEANSHLGASTLIGSRVWDQQSKYRVRLGPLMFRQFEAFLPGGSANKALRSIISFFTGVELDFDIQLVLKAKQVPGTVLTTRALRRPQLGWTSFLKTRAFTRDDEQLILQSV
jgi:type VI secretion system protein ImpH